jgi:hypothetical protein
MPSQEVMKAAMQAYIDTFNRGSAEAVAALYTEGATLEDPVGSPLKRDPQFLHSLDRHRGEAVAGRADTRLARQLGRHGLQRQNRLAHGAGDRRHDLR